MKIPKRARIGNKIDGFFHCQVAREGQHRDQAVRHLLLERHRPPLQTPQGAQRQDLHRRHHHLQGEKHSHPSYRSRSGHRFDNHLWTELWTIVLSCQPSLVCMSSV